MTTAAGSITAGSVGITTGAAWFAGAAAFTAGALGVLACAQAAAALWPALRSRAPRAAAAVGAAVEAGARIGREGRDPAARERRRLLAGGAVVAALLGLVVAGPLAALAAGALGPWTAARLLRARRARYGAAVDAEAAAIAVAIADAVGGGHSLRAAVAEAARSVPGAAGHELRRAAAELAAGATTGDALEALRDRTGSPRVGTVVAACLLQHRAGGDLSALLRECATGFEDESRLRDEVRAATAQARFTGLVVVLLPLGGGLLAELAAPGFLGELWRSPLTAWLVGVAIALQVAAAALIRRLGRPRL